MLKKVLISLAIGIGILIVLLVGMVLKPVPIVTEDEALTEKGIVRSISEGGTNDVVFILENNDTRFYINRGLENGLDLNLLRTKLIGQEVVFKYPKYWTPLDWDNKIRHLSKIEFGNKIIFNELKSE